MFARLSPTDLLKETEKSIGDGELHRIHAQLIEKKNEETDTSHVSVPVIVAVPCVRNRPPHRCCGLYKCGNFCTDSRACKDSTHPVTSRAPPLHTVGRSAGC